MAQTNPHAHAQATPPAQAGPAHGSGSMHFFVAVVLAILTILAFVAVGKGLLPKGLLLPLILALAVVQIALQTLFYMRLRWDSRMFAILFAGGVVLAVVIALAVKVLLSLQQ